MNTYRAVVQRRVEPVHHWVRALSRSSTSCTKLLTCECARKRNPVYLHGLEKYRDCAQRNTFFDIVPVGISTIKLLISMLKVFMKRLPQFDRRVNQVVKRYRQSKIPMVKARSLASNMIWQGKMR
jgi:hypothetical protein